MQKTRPPAAGALDDLLTDGLFIASGGFPLRRGRGCRPNQRGQTSDHFALELGEGRKHVKREPSHRGSGVEGLCHRDGGGPLRAQSFDATGEVGKRAGEAVDLVDDDHADAPGLDLGDQRRSAGPFRERAARRRHQMRLACAMKSGGFHSSDGCLPDGVSPPSAGTGLRRCRDRSRRAHG